MNKELYEVKIEARNAVIALPFFLAINGFVISVLWGWFISPTLNIDEITFFQAIGIFVFISYFKPYKENIKKIEFKKSAKIAIIKSFIYLVFFYPLSFLV